MIGTSVSAETGGGRPAGGLARRLLLRALFTAGVIGGTAGALAPVLVRRHESARRGQAPGGQRSLERFAETYRGRHIQGSATVMVPLGAGAGAPAAVPSVEVRVDGRPLHVMRRADGSYLSLVNHYESFPTLREVARAAVDELGDSQLSMTPPHHI
ncbi:tyrosinase family oxidase copper chaperone [Streptomyces zhihengii]|uniref:Tyrosinase n=1 Tax=Streptomyces zhihengii TaxID=1818004 RepID=A0ABS2URC9_9ACTN|nr:tyrosinase family oxidase copper chaperone [Streptomyces zhihengii]MBM9619638.1 tyrosinase [Streptomyces zhihengii]